MDVVERESSDSLTADVGGTQVRAERVGPLPGETARPPPDSSFLAAAAARPSSPSSLASLSVESCVRASQRVPWGDVALWRTSSSLAPSGRQHHRRGSAPRQLRLRCWRPCGYASPTKLCHDQGSLALAVRTALWPQSALWSVCPARLSVGHRTLPCPVSLQAEGPADCGHKDLLKGLTHRSPRTNAPHSLVALALPVALVTGLLVHSPVLLQSVSEKLEKKRGLVTFIVSRATGGQLRPAPQAVRGAPHPFQMIHSENS